MGHTDRAALIAWVKDRCGRIRQCAESSRRMEQAWVEELNKADSRKRAESAEAEVAILDAIAALLEAEAWQPIATAPKDHSFILVFLPGNPRPVQSVQWAQSYEEDVIGFWATPFGPAGRGYTVLIDAPIHWRPLPAPPVTEAQS